MTRIERTLRDGGESLETATRVAARLAAMPGLTAADLQTVRTAANQARQAAMHFDVLAGMLEAQLETQ